MVQKIKEDFHKHVKSHSHAWNGLYLIFVSQLNFRIELLVMLLVFAAGVYFQLSLIEWYGIIFSVTIVLLTEAMNSAIEKACDAITTRHHGAIKYAKDVAAGAVLVASAAAIVVGVFVFGPHIVPLLPR
ncbi:MAG: diacylglycerol kinase family protein [Candidatus Dojkabacteria bacterium]|nr:MAG: diacylglycerol kinase family protein [Candidatus Dojkabacteria bacterium]